MPAHTYYIELSHDEQDYLTSLIKTRTLQAQVVDRARILLWKSEARSDKSIADSLGISVNTVRRCIDQYLSGGTNLALLMKNVPAVHPRSQMMQKPGSPALHAKNHVSLAMPQSYGHWQHYISISKYMLNRQVTHA